MINRNKFGQSVASTLAIASTLGLLLLTGCSSSLASKPSANASANAPIAEANSSATLVNDSGLNAMTKLVADTKTAVEAKDFATAKTTGKQIEDAWKQIEDSIKDTDKTAYDAVEENLDGLNNELKGANPDTAVLVSHLDMLTTTLNGVSK